MGQSPKSENYTQNPKDFILIQGNADIQKRGVLPRVWTKQVTKMAKENETIISVRAPVGVVGKTTTQAVIGRGVASLSENDFVYQLLIKLEQSQFWGKISKGSTFQSIDSNDLKNLINCFPNSQEQNKIGILLKKVDKAITVNQRKLDKLKLQKRLCFNKCFQRKIQLNRELDLLTLLKIGKRVS